MRGNNVYLLIALALSPLILFLYVCESSGVPVPVAIAARFSAVWQYYWSYDPSSHPFTYFRLVLGMWWMGVWPLLIPRWIVGRLMGRNNFVVRWIGAAIMAFTLFCVLILEIGALGSWLGWIVGALSLGLLGVLVYRNVAAIVAFLTP